MNFSKNSIRWLIFRLFGPSELKNLVNYIDETTDNDYNIIIYPMGEFPFVVKTSNDDDLEPIIFPTSQERTAFQNGLNYGIHIMGGTTTSLSKEEYDEMNKMDKLSTHSSKKTCLN